MYACVCVSIRIYFGLGHCALVLSIVFACLSAMIALLLLGVFVIAPMVGGAGAYGHIVAVSLPDMSPLWPLRFAIAWTLVSLLLISGLFRLWRNHRT
jgi:hypothetical protein